jgi:hypothetical protein
MLSLHETFVRFGYPVLLPLIIVNLLFQTIMSILIIQKEVQNKISGKISTL